MGTRAALATGTAVSLTVTAVWSWTAVLTIGPAVPPRFGRDLLADYASLAASPTGNGPALFTVTAVIYTLCFLVSGLRARRRALREAARDLTPSGETDETTPALASGGRH